MNFALTHLPSTSTNSATTIDQNWASKQLRTWSCWPWRCNRLSVQLLTSSGAQKCLNQQCCHGKTAKTKRGLSHKRRPNGILVLSLAQNHQTQQSPSWVLECWGDADPPSPATMRDISKVAIAKCRWCSEPYRLEGTLIITYQAQQRLNE